jgi:hypothetical protein
VIAERLTYWSRLLAAYYSESDGGILPAKDLNIHKARIKLSSV